MSKIYTLVTMKKGRNMEAIGFLGGTGGKELRANAGDLKKQGSVWLEDP